MKTLLFLISFLIIYGSIYPFDFDFQAGGSEAWSALWGTWLSGTHKGDLLANILIFFPFGITGYHCFKEKTPILHRYVFVLLYAAFIGFGLQFVQLYLPSRDASLFDGVLNMAGTVLGLVAAVPLKANLASVSSRVRVNFSLPMLLVFLWFSYRLIPLVPTLDWQEIKESLKPLLLSPQIEVLSVSHDFFAWAFIFFVLDKVIHIRRSQYFYPLIIVGCLVLEVFIVSNSISLSNVIGAFLGYVIWLVIRHLKNVKVELILLTILVSYLAIYALYPLQISPVYNTFSWIPFSGFLGNSMYFNTLSFLDKVFLYGAFVWLLGSMGFKKITIALLSAGYLLFLEICQVFLIGHSPEITDPLLCLILVHFFIVTREKNPAIYFGEVRTEVSLENFSIKLFPVSKELKGQIPEHGIVISTLPFFVGRISDESANKESNDSGLLLKDSKPYRLSRKHFKIIIKEGRLAIMDCDSTLGTKVNGVFIGRSSRKKWAPLSVGANKIIAGKNGGIEFLLFVLNKKPNSI